VLIVELSAAAFVTARWPWVSMASVALQAELIDLA
jgi:hypothetical protein